MRIIADRLPWYGGLALLFKGGQDCKHVVKPLELDPEPLKQGVCCEPTVTLSNEEAQQLIDELYRCGLRPTESHGSAGQLQATQDHLADMKQIAGDLLNKILGTKAKK